MLIDYEQELTTKDGQDLAGVASGYGTKSYDQKAAADAAVGEPLEAFFKIVDANVDAATSILFSIVGDDDGAGTNEVTILSKSFALAALTTALGVRSIGRLPRGTSKKHYRFKWAVTGANPTQGAIVAWLSKGSDAARANAAGTI
jgi:hypothetical protein